MRLMSYESVIVFRFVFSRKIRGPATFDFCNNIGHKETYAVQQGLLNHLVGGDQAAALVR
jgi:hypothetical protein